MFLWGSPEGMPNIHNRLQHCISWSSANLFTNKQAWRSLVQFQISMKLLCCFFSFHVELSETEQFQQNFARRFVLVNFNSIIKHISSLHGHTQKKQNLSFHNHACDFEM